MEYNFFFPFLVTSIRRIKAKDNQILLVYKNTCNANKTQDLSMVQFVCTQWWGVIIRRSFWTVHTEICQFTTLMQGPVICLDFFLFFVLLSEKMGSSLDMSRFLSSSCQHVVKRILAYTLLNASYPFLLFFCCGCRHSINIVFAWKMKSHSISNSSILNNHNLKWRPNWNYAKFNPSTTCRKIHIFQSYLSHNEISHHVNSPYPLQPSPPCQPCTL